jgi:hypothetical protein
MESMTILVLALATLVTTNVAAISLDRDQRRTARRRAGSTSRG